MSLLNNTLKGSADTSDKDNLVPRGWHFRLYRGMPTLIFDAGGRGMGEYFLYSLHVKAPPKTWWVLNQVLYGEAALPQCPTPHPYIPLLPRKGTSFVYLLLTNGTVSPTYLELCIPFNCCKYTVSKIWINHKTRTFSWLFQCHKIDLLALVMHQNNRIPLILSS